MKYAELKKVGKLVAENDVYDGCAYLYTEEVWEYNGNFYIHEEHPNKWRYTGKSHTSFWGDDLDFIIYFLQNRGFLTEDLTEYGKSIFPKDVLWYNDEQHNFLYRR